MSRNSYTAIIEREGNRFVSLCPELDVASQGYTIEDAVANLKEAVELFLECADPSEIVRRTRGEVFVTRFEAEVAARPNVSRRVLPPAYFDLIGVVDDDTLMVHPQPPLPPPVEIE